MKAVWQEYRPLVAPVSAILVALAIWGSHAALLGGGAAIVTALAIMAVSHWMRTLWPELTPRGRVWFRFGTRTLTSLVLCWIVAANAWTVMPLLVVVAFVVAAIYSLGALR